MTNNVLILGAGFSYDAGVPLLGQFIEKMRRYAIKSMSTKGPLSEEDKIIFREAMDIMNDFDKFHGRSAFDDRNIEDILSILSFYLIGGKNTEQLKLKTMISAIARTIELSCNVTHDGRLDNVQGEGNELYRLFWKFLFDRYRETGDIPTIITFNYDLVLERALFQQLLPKNFIEFPFDGFILRYNYKWVKEKVYRIVPRMVGDVQIGTKLSNCNVGDLGKPITIEILKLHGSLNFPDAMTSSEVEDNPPTNVVSNPFIIPPISNKSLSENAEEIWRVALERLGQTKNIVVVGYSLPRTDIYIQYFFRAALGPNQDINKITVFNPDLFENTESKREMMDRYSSCFSEQLRRRIIYQPEHFLDPIHLPKKYLGYFKHFVDSILSNKELFF